MVVVMKERASEAQIDAVIARLIELGMDVHRSSGVTRTVLGVVGAHKIDPELVGILDGVHEVLRISEPYKRASRSFKPEDTVVSMDDVRIGGDEVIVMAGPCSAESDEQVMASAAADLAGPLTSDAVVRIFERVIDEARRAERESGSTGEDFGPASVE